jgi:hypothetical protein
MAVQYSGVSGNITFELPILDEDIHLGWNLRYQFGMRSIAKEKGRHSGGSEVKDQQTLPELSVIVITPDCYETVRTLVRALSRQTTRGRIELVFCAPSRTQLDLDEEDLADFESHQIVEIGELRSSAVARTAGVKAARGAIVAFSEDHCFPQPGWAEAIVARHRGPWVGVGPAMVNANPQSRMSWANFLIEYGEWAAPTPGGPWDHIPGHNSTYKRSALLEYGDDLSRILEAESPMQWDMRIRGHQFYLEPCARVDHWNFSLPGATFNLRFWGGRLFAANRARGWGLARRAVYFAASPLIPVLRFARTIRYSRRIRPTINGPGLVFLVAFMLVLDGIGEMVGYATGAGSAMDRLSSWGEFHRSRFLRPQEKQASENLASPSDFTGS